MTLRKAPPKDTYKVVAALAQMQGADLRKRTSLTSGTALGGKCGIDASSAQYTPSTRQDIVPTEDHRDVVGAIMAAAQSVRGGRP